jgi:hypothetical protein
MSRLMIWGLIPLVLSAQAPGTRLPQAKVTALVDGSRNPELIPDIIAYRHFFGVIARRPSSELDEARRQSYLRAFFRSNCGTNGNDDRSLSDDQVRRLLAIVDGLTPKLHAITAKLSDLRQTGSLTLQAQIALQSERDGELLKAADSIMAEDSDMGAKIARHVRDHMKSRIKLTIVDIPGL